MSGAVANDRLAELAAETDEAHVLAEIAERIRQHIRRTTADIIATGRDLIYVKEKLGHGGFLQWLDHEFLMSSRTARNYIAAAQWAEGKSETVANLPPSTVYLLAAPSTPDSFKQKVIEDLEAGRRLNPAVLEQLVKEERHLERDRKWRNKRRRELASRSKRAVQREAKLQQAERDRWAQREQLKREAQGEALSILAKKACKVAGIPFKGWVRREIKFSYTEAVRLAKIGGGDDPQKALADLRRQNADRNRKHQDQKVASRDATLPAPRVRILELLPHIGLQYWRDERDRANTGEPRNDDAGAPVEQDDVDAQVEQPANPEDDPFYIPPFLDRRPAAGRLA